MVSKLAGLLQNGFVRFIIVGLINTIIGLTVTFICLNALGLNYWASTIVGNLVGAINSYFMNKSFTFRSKESVGKTAWKFVLITAVCYFLAYWLAARLADQGLIWLMPEASTKLKNNAAALMGSVLYTVLNYIGQKRITFASKQEGTMSHPSLPEREESGAS